MATSEDQQIRNAILQLLEEYGNTGQIDLQNLPLLQQIIQQQVERGLQRVNNPDYQNFKTEAELKGLQVNRFTDEKIFQAEKVINQARLEQEKSLKFFKESQNKLADLESKHQQFDKKVSKTKDLIDHISDEINPQSKIERKLNLAVNFSSNHLYNPFEISIEVFLNL